MILTSFLWVSTAFAIDDKGCTEFAKSAIEQKAIAFELNGFVKSDFSINLNYFSGTFGEKPVSFGDFYREKEGWIKYYADLAGLTPEVAKTEGLAEQIVMIRLSEYMPEYLQFEFIYSETESCNCKYSDPSYAQITCHVVDRTKK